MDFVVYLQLPEEREYLREPLVDRLFVLRGEDTLATGLPPRLGCAEDFNVPLILL